MSQTSPFGPPVTDDPTGEAPAVESAGPPEKKPRIALLAVAGTAVVGIAAVLGFLLMSGTSDDGLGFTGQVTGAPQAGQTPQPAQSPTPLPTESTVNARNPFLAPPSPTPSVSATSASSAPAAPVTSTPPSAATTTKAASHDVFVTLVKLDKNDGDATFTVISPAERASKRWSVAVGDRFGKSWGSSTEAPFLYREVVFKGDDDLCAKVKFVDSDATRICTGQTVQVQ